MKRLIALGAVVPLGILSIFLIFLMVQLALSLVETIQILSSS